MLFHFPDSRECSSYAGGTCLQSSQTRLNGDVVQGYTAYPCFYRQFPQGIMQLAGIYPPSLLGAADARQARAKGMLLGIRETTAESHAMHARYPQ